jgi:hypothetical protein
LRFDGIGLGFREIEGLQIELNRAAEGRVRPLPRHRPIGQLRTLLASLG